MRAELDEFVGEVFASLARKDQRAKGGLYLRGLTWIVSPSGDFAG